VLLRAAVAFGLPLLGVGYLFCQVAVLRSNFEKQRFEIAIISLGCASLVQGRPAQIAPRLVFLRGDWAPVCGEPTEKDFIEIAAVLFGLAHFRRLGRGPGQAWYNPALSSEHHF